MSLTKVKGAVWDSKDNGLGVNVKDYGAVGDGVTDDTAAIQAALDYAATNGKEVYCSGGDTYKITTLLVKNGTKSFTSNGAVLVPLGSTNPSNLTTEAVIVLQGDLTGGAAVDDCIIGLEIDMQNGDRTAILGDGCTACTFVNNRIYGFTNDAANNHRGIRLQEGPTRNRITNNEIVGYSSPTQRGMLIDIWASLTGLPSFGGFFTGTVSTATSPADRNIISENILTNGSYAVNMQGCEHTVVSNNIMHNQNHRGMWVGNASWYNTISDNIITTFASSAVLLGYGACHNLVSNNHCRNEGAHGVGGEAVININTGSSYNLIIGNHLDAPLNYSVYISTDSSNNVIDGNYSKNAYVACFAVENDLISTRPTNNFYSRPNYEDPTLLDPPNSTSWTYNDLENTIFQNNVIHSGYAGRVPPAFFISQIENDLIGATATKLTGVTLKNNTVLTNINMGYGVCIYEHVAAQLTKVKAIGNSWPEEMVASTLDFTGMNTISATIDMRDVGLIYSKNNGVLDDLIGATPITFTDADATPDVSTWEFFNFANTAATDVTDFDGGYDGQEIMLRGDPNTTIKYNSALIRTKGAVDVVIGSSNNLIRFKLLGSIWFEMWRNF